jgi:hypothetical protein
MSLGRRALISIASLGIAVVAYVGYSFPIKARYGTDVNMTIQGGFAYVNDKNSAKVSLGFMNSYNVNTDTNVCQVTQVGLDLYVDDGDILEPAGWLNTTPFDPRGPGAVTISAPLFLSNADPRRQNGQPSPADPANGDLDSQWQDNRFVPSVSTFFQGNPLNANWQTLVNGYFELIRGTLTGGKPSDMNTRHADWRFRKDSDSATSPVFNQALTDVTTYATTVFGNEITINMPNAIAAVKKVRVRSSGGRAIHLILAGRHEMNTPTGYNDDDPIKHFCIYYQLMDPIPNKSTWLLPHYKGVMGPSGSQGSGTPGAFCPGDGF